ncbi:MAG: DAK2 domain-containing protein [Oscillospiraceae bacterium]|nr:DAK2 domain-containing protein [Oscillospiraceae bacterium]
MEESIVTEILTGAVFANMIHNGAAAIELHKNEINELNVFPVPDGDTGTNMSLTMNNGSNEVKKISAESVTKVADAAASGLLRGARGNSGVILSLLFRGISKSLKGKETATAEDFAKAMSAGVEAAYKAVMKPAEGTILTVSRLSAAAAVKCAEDEKDVEAVMQYAIEEAKVALADTINLNPVLKKAGVVDSGGKGFIYILEGMLRAVKGEIMERVEVEDVEMAADFTEFDTEDITFTYCTEFIVSRENNKDPDILRGFLNEIGDSIVVVDDDEIIKTHVHTNQPGDVLTAALTYGSLLTVKIENMREQHTAKVVEATAETETEDKVAAPEKQYGFVAVCAGEGMAEIFRSVGVDAIVTGGQTMNPSTEDILKQINSVPAEVVFVLPNNKNIVMAAQQSIPLSEKRVIVIPTGTVPQGITAALVFDESASPEENEQMMTDAAATVHTASVTYAARDSEFDGHSITAGEYLALLDGSLVSNDSEIANVVTGTADALEKHSPEIITVYYGEDVTEEDAEKVGGMLSEKYPDADVMVLYGGQPVYYYVISAE